MTIMLIGEQGRSGSKQTRKRVLFDSDKIDTGNRKVKRKKFFDHTAGMRIRTKVKPRSPGPKEENGWTCPKGNR